MHEKHHEQTPNLSFCDFFPFFFPLPPFNENSPFIHYARIQIALSKRVAEQTWILL